MQDQRQARQQAGNRAGRGAKGNRSSGHRAIRNTTRRKDYGGIKVYEK